MILVPAEVVKNINIAVVRNDYVAGHGVNNNSAVRMYKIVERLYYVFVYYVWYTNLYTVCYSLTQENKDDVGNKSKDSEKVENVTTEE